MVNQMIDRGQSRLTVACGVECDPRICCDAAKSQLGVFELRNILLMIGRMPKFVTFLL
jgi:hypothetical protein